MYELVLIAGVILWVGLLLYYLRQPSASAFHPATFYFLFHGLVFTIRPILAYMYDYRKMYYAYAFLPTVETKIQALLVADLGLVTFIVVVLNVASAPMTWRATGVSDNFRMWGLERFAIISALLTPVAVYSLYTAVNEKVRDINTMILDAYTGYTVNTTSNGYFVDAQSMLGPIVVVIAWLFRFRPVALIPFALYLLVKAGTGGRWQFVLAAMSLCLFYLYDRRQRWFSPAVVVVGIGVLAMFSAVGADRGAAARSLLTGEAVVTAAEVDAWGMPADRLLESMDYANKEFLEFIVGTIPEKTGTYGYFLDNLQLLTEPVPRVLWPNKPVGAPVKLYSLFDYGYPIGMTFSLPGEGWAQFGWMGVVMWTGLFAVALGKIYNWFVKGQRNPYNVAVYLVYLPLTITFFRDGFLLTILKLGFFTLLPVLLWQLTASRANRALARIGALPANVAVQPHSAE